MVEKQEELQGEEELSFKVSVMLSQHKDKDHYLMTLANRNFKVEIGDYYFWDPLICFCIIYRVLLIFEFIFLHYIPSTINFRIPYVTLDDMKKSDSCDPLIVNNNLDVHVFLHDILIFEFIFPNYYTFQKSMILYIFLVEVYIIPFHTLLRVYLLKSEMKEEYFFSLCSC